MERARHDPGMSILITFHSREGQTAKIARRIGEQLRGLGLEVELAEVSAAPAPQGYDALVAGDAIRYERHSRKLVRYLRRNRAALSDMPVAVFQVSMTSAGTDPAHVSKADEFAQNLVDAAGVHPALVAMFAGSLAYSQYGWVMKRVMRSIARREGNDTDITRDHEYTDWDAVDRFARNVADMVTTRLPSEQQH